MSTRHRHPALRSRPTCDHVGPSFAATGHECVCWREPGHDADGSTLRAWHKCSCGDTWTDVTNAELEPEPTVASETPSPGATVYQLFADDSLVTADEDDEGLLYTIDESIARLTVDEIDECDTVECRRAVVRRLIERLRDALA